MTDAEKVRQAIERWYSANYPLGVRLMSMQRDALADAVIRRLGLVDDSKEKAR